MPNYNDDPNMVPLMRMSPYGGYATPTKRYAKPDNAKPLSAGQKALAKSEEGKKAVANMTGQTVEEVSDAALTRKMKYCGGTSKPYGKKK